MTDFLLVLNPGSTSIKFSVYLVEEDDQFAVEIEGEIEHIGEQAAFKVTDHNGQVQVQQELDMEEDLHHGTLIQFLLDFLHDYLDDGRLLAVGHRVVHGGTRYESPVVIDEPVLRELENLIPLAPLHQPQSLAIIDAIRTTLPTLPQIACFDTAFHRTQAKVEQLFAIPRRYIDEGIHRYGFHGLSYEYISKVMDGYNPALSSARVIVAHLGNGASLCAMQNGKSLATTMSFSPLDGLVMGTRCGSLDPGVLLYLLQHHHMTEHELEQMLYHESGLLGVSGISNDMRVLLESGDEYAKQAIDLFVHRLTREIGALAAVLGGLDALIFTAGIGQHSPDIRAAVCEQAAWLGVKIDNDANIAGDFCISRQDSSVSVWILHTDENRMIANHTLNLLKSN